MNKIANQFVSTWNVQNQSANLKKSVKSEKVADKPFEDVLKLKETNSKELLSFSKHASNRLEQRHISLTEMQMNRLRNGVEQAREKNINDSLVLVDNMAFIVNVNSNTVITALNSNEQQKIFTNIDGAVIS